MQFTSVTLLGGNATFSPTTFSYAIDRRRHREFDSWVRSMKRAPAPASPSTGMTTVFLKGAGTYTGSTNINRGTLQLMASDLIPNTSNMTMGNAATGTVPTFATGGFNETLGTLSVGTDGAAIDFGAAASTLHFAASNALSWNGPVTINNWTGGSDHLFFGASATGLTAGQLGGISFAGHNAGARISTIGEVTPLPVLLLGDFNQDGHVNGTDITSAMAALTDLTSYQAGLGVSNTELAQIGDLTGDGKVNNLDLQGLLTYLIQGHGSVAAVPEPGTISLLALGGAAIGFVAARRRKGR